MPSPSTTSADTTDFDATDADFACIDDWRQIRDFRITNLLGKTDEAVAVANNGDIGDFPVGTVVQVIPEHAMVKRKAGFNPTGGDWEFFELDCSASGTTIVQRGGAEVTAPQIGSCQKCHDAARRENFLCERNHGCKSNGHTPAELLTMQADDPRCAATTASP